MTNDLDIFPTVAWIPDTMLQKFNPVDPILLAYLQTINPSIETGVLFAKGVVGTSKRIKGSKKVTKASPSKPDTSPRKIVKSSTVPTEKETKKPVQEKVVQESAKEVMPS